MEYGTNSILLVEDDIDDAEMIIYTLKKLNAFAFKHIDDGVIALDYLFDATAPEPALILLDLKMPKVDGIEILQKLKSHPEKKRIPVVALISSKEGKRYLESFGTKPDAYLMKPVDCLNFVAVLTELGLSGSIVFTRRQEI